MHPTIFEIPWLNLPIRAYGLMLMIGFLGGTWWAARRAARVKADPDFVINMGFVALISSVVGARLFYVIHYWENHFAHRPLWAAVDITAGGMEFYGGFLGAFVAILVYMAIKRVSMRMYFDIIAPSLMFGLGVTRIGCFLNGCCWGAVCDPNQIPWAVKFPYASPAAYRQWEEREITFPAELITVYSDGSGSLIPRDELAAETDHHRRILSAYREAQRALATARKENADAATLARLTKQYEAAKAASRESARELAHATQQQAKFALTIDELRHLAGEDENHTHGVHPVQLYAAVNGLLTAVLLNALFYRRKQHGLVLALILILYPIMRFAEEIIRSDNPHDVIGLTISQFISVGLFVGGIIFLVAIYRMPSNVAARVVPARAVPAKAADSQRGRKDRHGSRK